MTALYKKNLVRFITLVSLCVLFVFFGIIRVAVAVETGDPAAGSDPSWLNKLGNTIGNFILYIGAYITGFGGLLLDASIDKFIIKINELIGNGTPLGNSITAVWILIRDVCNLAFIFGFIYVGIRTIIDADSSATKRMLASIIIGALLINFSLFFAKVTIDVSNYISYEIYTTLVDTKNGGSIALSFRDILGVRSIYTMPDPKEFNNMTTGGNIAYYFMATLMLIVAGFVLAAGAVLLMIRFVMLVLILCFSPILFAATVFPGTQEHAKKLWHKLLSYSFFAPVYLLLLIVSINILNGVVATMRKGPLSSALANQGAQGTSQVDLYGVILSYGVAIFFLIISLQIATKFGIAGADKVIATGQHLRGKGQKMLGGATLGLGAAASRATIGRVAHKYADSDWAKDKASRSGIGGWTARRALKGSRVVADSSLDARKIGGVGDKLGIGEGRKGGYKTVKDEVKKKEEEFAKSLGEIDDTDVKVKARKVEHGAAEKQLRLMEEVLNKARRDPTTTAAALAQMREDIEDQKEKIEKAKAKYEQEKMRRVVGSSYAQPDNQEDKDAIREHEREVKFVEDQIKDAWKDYASLTTDVAKETRRKEIDDLMTEVTRVKKYQYEFLTKAIDDRGYAGVLERDNIFTSWPVGRYARNNRYAGKKMREARQKGKPKDKDD